MENSEFIEEKLRLKDRFHSGANWFYWIAGLSLINTLILIFGGDWSFIVGLGITQLVDVLVYEIINDYLNYIALGIDVVIAGIFVMFGVFANKGKSWSFIVGMVLYALDGLLFIMVEDWLSIGFHVFALYSIFNGYQAKLQLSKIEEEAGNKDDNLPNTDTVN